MGKYEHSTCKDELKEAPRPEHSRETILVRNLLLLASTLVIGALLLVILGKLNLNLLTGIIYIIMVFLITFSVKNVIVELAALRIRRKK